ncbi:acetamidase/formamidase family protein [Lutimonas saemankumensis]|uniref:acetamidase/formamidase family protein n=1 Tax=Lutimonas saemankumensis TaxID=483016 RepID=UPI001CD7D2AE|nr:acetamidase/formamidase family protein [Lutimonas saemankumensis]MCA0931352.1 acetamidase/formamidase family protein [Lutimonas saemankumensis]
MKISSYTLTLSLILSFLIFPALFAQKIEVGDNSVLCKDDPDCINRIHPAIPMLKQANPGDTIVFNSRNADDRILDPNAPEIEREDDPQIGWVHPLTGPVRINGAMPGDVLKVNIISVDPGPWAWTITSGIVSDEVEGFLMVKWKLGKEFATSEDLPGIKLPNRSFPGVVSVLPSVEKHAEMLKREQELHDAGGDVLIPGSKFALPESICGEGGKYEDECLRTIPPREHGGNLDIRYLQAGSSIYLPCFVEGAGLSIGDPHYIQGDGEVSGTALEMDAVITVTTEIINNGPDLSRGPHYEGPSKLLDIPSTKFYATTGFPIKDKAAIPPHLEYLSSEKISGLENLSNDIYLAARNALLEMIEYISETYGYSKLQAYIIASVAVDLKIGQLVDVPNVGVTAVLPLDIFEQND